jgi:hypothetical protein
MKATPDDESKPGRWRQTRTMEANPDDETVVADSGVPGLFGEAVNELMCPAS